MGKYNQLCVWEGTLLDDSGPKGFIQFLKGEFGARFKFAEEVKTLPDRKGGTVVPDTGGRNDLFFYVHDDDSSKFALPRLNYGIRWWEDVLSNGGRELYPNEVLERYPYGWLEANK